MKCDEPIHLLDVDDKRLCAAESERKIKAALDEIDAVERTGGGARSIERLRRRIRSVESYQRRVAKQPALSVVDGVRRATCAACLARLDRRPQIRVIAANAERARDEAMGVARVG